MPQFHRMMFLLWVIELNQARNRAVHEGEDPQFQVLDRGIFSADALIQFVHSR